MAGPTSIYLDDDVERALAARAGEGERSEKVRQIVGRYEEIARRHRPRLALAEWLLVCDVLNGTWLAEPGHVGLIYAEVEDWIRLDDLDAKWGIDGPALVARARAWSYAEAVAVADLAERFWAARARGEALELPDQSQP